MENKLILADKKVLNLGEEFNSKLTKTILSEIAKEGLHLRETECDVNFIIAGSGKVRKGEDYSQIQNFAVPYAELLQLALSKLNGVTLESIVNEYLNSDIDSKDFKKRASKALATIKGTKVQNFKGKVTVKDVQSLRVKTEIS